MCPRVWSAGIVALALLIGCGGESTEPEPSPAPVATVALNVDQDTILVRATIRLVATLRDSNGNTLEDRFITWSTSDPTRASVSQSGEVRALGLGTATITAASEGKSASAGLTLAPRITVSRRLPTTFVGDTTRLTAALTDALRNPLSRGVEEWSSSDETVATVSSDGIVTGVSVGTATIRAAASGGSGGVDVVVLEPRLRTNREITYLRSDLTEQMNPINQLYRVDADGSGQGLLSAPNQNLTDWDWSPSGDRIALTYVPVEEGGSSGLYTINPDGSDPRLLLPGPVPRPRWSPDGRRILFTRGSPAQVYTVNADGTGLAALTSLVFDQASPKWSPDGRQIAFTSNLCNSLYIMDADGKNQKEVLIPKGVCDFEWSPDGKLIATSTLFGWGPTGIWLVNSDGTNPRSFTGNCSPIGECTGNSEYLRPRWSPDGRRLAYLSITYDVGNLVHVANLDGSAATSFAIGIQVQDPTVEWSPDGTRLVFGSPQPLPSGLQSIVVSQADGNGQVRVTEDVYSHAPVWRP